MRCETCQAVVTENNVILSRGKQSLVKHYNRVCKYALERKKVCSNQCRIRDDSLSWEAEFKQLDVDLNKAINYLKSEC